MARTLVVWCPDWPVVAAARDAGCDPDEPIAVVEKGRVYACSQPARKEGVRRGLRVREAQAKCPKVTVLPYDPAVDARVFEPVVAAVEEMAPGVEVVRPGICAVATRGPSRYFGSEDAFAERLLDHLEFAGFYVVTGIADGVFAAEQAARSRAGVFPSGRTAECLASLPINTLERPDLVDLLRRLGIRTLGAFAALPAGHVLERFGTDGLLAHQLASGRGSRPLATRQPPPELATSACFDDPLDRVDQIAFSVKNAAEQLIDGLTERDLVCTSLRIEVHTDDDDVFEREWRHPRWFTAGDVIDRVRWQLQAGTMRGVVKVGLTPADVARTGCFAEGLWGDNAPDEKVHRALTRVQSLLGHEGVVTAQLSGGRALADRVTYVPWGDALTPERPAGQPWPGTLPKPAPSTVFDRPRPVDVDELGVSSWAGPWPVDERWWDPATRRQYDRYQVVCTNGDAYVLIHENDRWYVEAVYD